MVQSLLFCYYIVAQYDTCATMKLGSVFRLLQANLPFQFLPFHCTSHILLKFTNRCQRVVQKKTLFFTTNFFFLAMQVFGKVQ